MALLAVGHYGYEFYYETKNVCIANR